MFSNKKKLAIVGAGFYGLYLAQEALKKGWQVTIFEANKSPMALSGIFNQARVHGGYHYPRAFITGLQCQNHYMRFIDDFNDSIRQESEAHYAIANGSKVSPNRFVRFCNVIGAPLETVSNDLKELYNWNTISAVYKVREASFDASMIQDQLIRSISGLGGEIVFDSPILQVTEHMGGVKIVSENDSEFFSAAILCTYGFEIIAPIGVSFEGFIEAQICEMVLVELPKELQNINITVIDGPFWSLTEFPSMKTNVLSHVRHTPHRKYSSPKEANKVLQFNENLISRGSLMLKEASRHVPLMSELNIHKSIWGVKVVPKSLSNNDKRPILLRNSQKVLSVLGSKFDNVYDAADEVAEFLDSILE
jgi:hypothetical protein